MTQDRPDAPDLLEAVAEFLFSEVRDQVADEHRFQVLVAANSCAIVARELRAGVEPARADLALFRELLGDPSAGAGGDDLAAAVRKAAAALAERVRSGAADDELEETISRLREHACRKLDIVRPGYDS